MGLVRIGQDDPRTDPVDPSSSLGQRERGVKRCHDNVSASRGEQCYDKFDAIGRLQCDDIAGPQPTASKRRALIDDQFRQNAISDAATLSAEDQCRRVRGCFGDAVKNVTQLPRPCPSANGGDAAAHFSPE
jgi:hypothetical protein